MGRNIGTHWEVNGICVEQVSCLSTTYYNAGYYRLRAQVLHPSTDPNTILIFQMGHKF